MSLITDNQRKSAQEPKPTPAPPVPKPVRLQEYDLQPEFEQGQGELGFATEEQLGGSPEPAPETYVEFAAGQPEARTGTVVEPGQGYLTGLQGQLGQSLPEIPLPAAEAASTPPLTNLWKDATVDLGIPNLGDSRLTTATYPALYNTPFRSFDPGVGNTFVQGANASAQAEAQAQQQQQAAQARAIQEAQQRRGALPNTPDASKPWNEQLWGWASDVLLGDSKAQQEANAGKVDVLQGRFGKYGAGLGGYFKAAFGVPIAAATALALETWGKDEYRMQKRLLRAGNPTVRTESADRRSSIEKPFNSLSAEEQHNYLTEVVSNRLPLNLGSQIRINADLRKGFGDALLQALSGQVDDSVSDANPRLAPVKDQRTGQLAKVEPPKGLFYARNKRPGQGFLEDPGSAAIEIFAQLASPGNKVDLAGEALGIGLRAIARTNVAKATGRAVVNAVPKPVKQGVGAVANVAKRTAAGVATGTFGQKPVAAAISQPTPVVGVLKNPSLPRNTGAEFEAYLRNQAVVKPPVVPNVPAFDPTTTPVLPKTDPEGLAAVVGIGQKGQPLTFEPSVGLRTHQELVEQVLKQNPEKFGSYRGSTWAEWDAWKKANLGEEDIRQLEAVGAVQETTRVQTTATLDDLQTQARVLAEQKLSVEAPLKQLEEVFDETVDVGRRTVDQVPLRPLTEADVVKALDYEASLRLSRQLPAALVEAAAKGDTSSFLAQAEAFGGIPGLVQAHNTALLDLSSRVTPEVVANARIATEVPPVVYHGTALEQWQPYNVIETGSRGELGSALYTTRSYDEAAQYSRASVGNNRPTEIAYEPLAPQVVALDTSKLVAPLDARITLDSQDELVQAVVRNLPASVQENLGSLPKQLSFSDLTSRLERATAEVGGSEGLLKQVNDSVSDTLRASGYDSAYDPQSGWLAVLDNGKLSVVKQESFSPPSAVQAAVARYNADSLAAGHYPSHVTSDANLRDSSFQVLDQARNQLDEKLEEVQQQLQEATYTENVKPLVERAKELSNDALKARVKEPPSVERYKRDIQEFGQPLHPVVVRAEGVDKFVVVGNFEAYEAALASFDPRTYSKVSAIVLPSGKNTSWEKLYKLSDGAGYKLLDIDTLVKGKPEKLPSTRAALAEQHKTLGYTTNPVVLEETSFDSYRILDRSITANAYKDLYKKGYRSAESVPAVVIGKSGKVKFQQIDLASIERKAKALEPEVPRLEEAVAEIDTHKPSTLDDVLANVNNLTTEELAKAIKALDDPVLAARREAIEAIGEATETTFGTLVAPVAYRGKAEAILSSIEKKLTDFGLPVTKVRDIVFVDETADPKALQKLLRSQDEIRIGDTNAAYAPQRDSFIINAKLPSDELEPIIMHELMHVFESRLTDEAFLEFRDFIRESALKNFFPSDYSLTNKGEFMADTALAAMYKGNKSTKDMPEDLRQAFVGAWKKAAASLQETQQQPLDRLSEMLDYFMNEQAEAFFKAIAKEAEEAAAPTPKVTLADLKEEAAALGLSTRGTKAQLQAAIERQIEVNRIPDFPFENEAYISAKWSGGSPTAASDELKLMVQKLPSALQEPFVAQMKKKKLLYIKESSDGEIWSLSGSGDDLTAWQQVYKDVAYDHPEASTKALSSTEAPKAVDLKQAGDLAMRMFEYSNTNELAGKNTNNWATPALSGGIRLDNGVQYLKGIPIHKQFDLEQDVVGYASQLLREKATIEGDAGIFAEASATLGVDVPQYFLSVAQQVVEKLAKEQPEYLAKAIKRADKRTSAFVRYADDLLNNREVALPNLQKSISAFLEKQKSPEYLAKAEKAKAVASTNEFADDYDVLEEAKAANPHASLTEALDEVQAGKYDICDL